MKFNKDPEKIVNDW
jgi:rhomboid protease GluP